MVRYPTFRDRAPLYDEQMIVPPEVFEAARPNARRKPGPWSIPEDVQHPYGEYEGMLVRVVLLRNSNYDPSLESYHIASAADVAHLCRHMKYEAVENVICLALDGSNKLRAIYETAKGGLHGAAVQALDVLKIPILTGSPAYILIHNHPGGSLVFSRQDMHLTERLIAAGHCIGIELLDHVLVTTNGYLSMVESNLIAELGGSS